jgi:cyanophycinase
MRKSLRAWLVVLETQLHDVLSRLRQTITQAIATRPTPRRRASPSYNVEQVEVRLLLSANLGLANTPIFDTPALHGSPANVFDTNSIGEQNAGGKGGTSEPKSKDYAYTVVGSVADAAVNALSSGLALVGGGTDVDAVFTWLGAKANGGDFVVLRATGTGAYNSYIDKLVPALDSVATLVISTIAGANDAFVARTIRQAEAIFIAGGDQADYINLWKNSAVESAIYAAMARGAPIGGTSAGLDVLSDYDFSAQLGTITSAEALANPYDSRVILDSGFVNEGDFTAESGQHSVLHYLDNLVTDSHFQQRDRMGRLVTFMARIDQDGLASDPVPRGIGINEQTALLIEADGMARVVANPYSKKLPVADQQRAVYLLSATTKTKMNVTAGQPLTYTNVAVAKADVGDTFDLDDWLVPNGRDAWSDGGVTFYELSAYDADHDGDTDLISTQTAVAIY